MNRQPASASQEAKPSSLDEMNKMLMLTRGSAWLGLGVLLLIVLAVLLAIFLIRIPTHINTEGFSENGQMVCYINVADANDLKVGQPASVDLNMRGSVESISNSVYSEAEARSQIQDSYTQHLMKLSEWNVRVVISFEGHLDDELVHPVVITTNEIPLSSLFLGVSS